MDSQNIALCCIQILSKTKKNLMEKLLNETFVTPWGRKKLASMFKVIFLCENGFIIIQISLTFVPWVLVNNKPALFQIMAWHWTCDQSISGPMMASVSYMHHLAPGTNGIGYILQTTLNVARCGNFFHTNFFFFIPFFNIFQCMVWYIFVSPLNKLEFTWHLTFLLTKGWGLFLNCLN